PSPPPQRGRPPSGRRAGPGCGGPAPARLPDAGLGGFRPARRHRDPPVRRSEHPDRPALAGHAGKPDPNAAGTACGTAPAGIATAASVRGTLFYGAGGPRPGGDRRFPGCRRQARARPGGPAGQGGETPMTADQLINVLVTVTLVEMMAAVGLGVSLADLVGVAKQWRLVARAALANYVCVPAATVGLLLLFDADPMIAAGFLI